MEQTKRRNYPYYSKEYYNSKYYHDNNKRYSYRYHAKNKYDESREYDDYEEDYYYKNDDNSYYKKNYSNRRNEEYKGSNYSDSLYVYKNRHWQRKVEYIRREVIISSEPKIELLKVKFKLSDKEKELIIYKSQDINAQCKAFCTANNLDEILCKCITQKINAAVNSINWIKSMTLTQTRIEYLDSIKKLYESSA